MKRSVPRIAPPARAAMARLRCRLDGGGTPFSAAERRRWQARLGSGWRIERGALAATYRFPDFARALAFAVAVGRLAERAWHHPDLDVGWGRAGVRLVTHSIGGIGWNDFVLAARIAALAARRRAVASAR